MRAFAKVAKTAAVGKAKAGKTKSTSPASASSGPEGVLMSRFEKKDWTRSFVPYATLASTLQHARSALNRPLTLSEKILYSHLDDPKSAASIVRGQSYLKLRPGIFGVVGEVFG